MTDTHRSTGAVAPDGSPVDIYRAQPQPFTARLLDEPGVTARLAEAGLRLDGWLDEDRGWLIARPQRKPPAQEAGSTATTRADQGQ